MPGVHPDGVLHVPGADQDAVQLSAEDPGAGQVAGRIQRSDYLLFYNEGGNPKAIKGYQNTTKIRIVKSIYAKFLSLPETQSEEFDFIDFIQNENTERYDGIWKLYFVRRDYSCDIYGMPDIGTGKVEFKEGIVYELSDDKFIFNLMNFTRHDCFNMKDDRENGSRRNHRAGSSKRFCIVI